MGTWSYAETLCGPVVTMALGRAAPSTSPEPLPDLRGGSRNWLPWVAGAITGLYSLLAWLTVIPNQDLLADGIQVQRLIADPMFVTSFPGQKHGGVLEYVYGIPAEILFPGNYLAHSAIRVVFAFLTGFLAAKLYREVFPGGPTWSFLLAVAAGPSILQGLAGPPTNPVGVYWLTTNYDLAWLFVTLGFWILAREINGFTRRAQRPGWLAASGFIIGIGVYQQPTIALLVVPLAILVLLRCAVGTRTLIWAAAGGLIGLIPSAINYFMPRTPSTWDPSHFPVFNPSLAIATLGLDGVPSYFPALFPYALGMAPSESASVGLWQSALTMIVLATIVITALVGGTRALVSRRRPGPGTAIALSWLGAVASVIAFGTVVDPVWFYGAGLAILLWISIGVLPVIIRPRAVGIATTILAVLIIAGSTISHNSYWYAALPDRVVTKIDYQNEQVKRAHSLLDLGATFVYGSYLDVLPVAYGSNASLHPITSTYNRFPVSATELRDEDSVLVGVNESPTEGWGESSLARVVRECRRTSTSTGAHPFAVFECPGSLLLEPKAD